jgi:hypothetical protein
METHHNVCVRQDMLRLFPLFLELGAKSDLRGTMAQVLDVES